MGALFKTPDVKIPDEQRPRPVRMPTETDPDVLAAAKRARQAAMQRRGRLSTILTDQTMATTGSQKLGA